MLPAGGQVCLGRGDEPVALLLDRPPLVRGEELVERSHCEPVLPDLVEDAPLRVIITLIHLKL